MKPQPSAGCSGRASLPACPKLADLAHMLLGDKSNVQTRHVPQSWWVPPSSSSVRGRLPAGQITHFPSLISVPSRCQRTTGSCLAKCKPSRQASPNGADGGKTALPAAESQGLCVRTQAVGSTGSPTENPSYGPTPASSSHLLCTEMKNPGPYSLLLSPSTFLRKSRVSFSLFLPVF